VNTRRDYSAELVEAARAVLIEVMHVLGEYRGEIVLVGGWVPDLLLPQAEQPHVGSIDIDLALDHRRFPPSLPQVEGTAGVSRLPRRRAAVRLLPHRDRGRA